MLIEEHLIQSLQRFYLVVFNTGISINCANSFFMVFVFY